jgi:bifunctional non-homologous end joining protein LigD
MVGLSNLAIAMALEEYQRKRQFSRTQEPKGQLASRLGRSFVVQKHAASHLHYDFRLELDGVLKSWAVPRGPCLDPTVKRLAIEVEDHPVSYGSFEGTIPQGQYGGGTVMLWDRGTWEPKTDPNRAYRSGRLKFILHGEKLRGGWMLVRRGGKKADKRKPQWLLFKERDVEAKPLSEGDVLDDESVSVTTGRDLDQIAAGSNSIKRNPSQSKGRAIKKRMSSESVGAKSKSKRSQKTLQPQLTTLTVEAPEGNEWYHEIKFDGYRMICRIENGESTFISRNGKDWTRRLSSLAEQASQLPVTQAILDGEVVALREDGTTHFQDLQNAFRNHRDEGLQYFVFDLLHLNGQDLTAFTLAQRKELLAELLSHRGVPAAIRLSEHVEGKGPAFFKEACQRGLEGIISKRKDGLIRPGRGTDWLKVKCVKKEEFVIGGYTDPNGEREGFGALLVGYFDQGGKLTYSGRVGTGFDRKLLQSLKKSLASDEQNNSPFANFHDRSRSTHWVRPHYVAQVEFGSWTSDGILRHASFQGLREDKTPQDVIRESPISIPSNIDAGKRKPLSLQSKKGKSSNRASAAPKSGYDPRTQQFAGVRLTSPEKILYPHEHITKLELAEYYQSMADWILPHIKDRPIVLTRCPDGQENTCFYQKHPGPGTPEMLKRVPIREKTKTDDYVVVDDVTGLISLAQIGSLEIHAWGSRTDKLEFPDRLIFDLDPDPSVEWKQVIHSARQVRAFLEELGLESFVKTTGGKGLHLVVPIDRRHDWDEAKTFCRQVANAIVSADPRHYTATMSKAARHGKIFLDYFRNDRGATAVIPYSPRAKASAPVSVPLAWDELSARIRSDHFTVQTIAKRLASLRHDPWKGIASRRQGLSGPRKVLQRVTGS